MIASKNAQHIYVSFTSYTFKLYARPSVDLCHNIKEKQCSRTPSMQLHPTLCHAGHDRVANSRITIDGKPVTRLPPSELGNLREHQEAGSTRRNTPKESKMVALCFGQCVYSGTCNGFPKVSLTCLPAR